MMEMLANFATVTILYALADQMQYHTFLNMLNKSPAVIYDIVSGLPIDIDDIPEIITVSSEDELIRKLKEPPYKTVDYRSVIIPFIKKMMPVLVAPCIIESMTRTIEELYTIIYTNNEEKDIK